MDKIHSSLTYHKDTFEELVPFCSGVANGYFDNDPPFTVHPFTKVAYQGMITDFDTKHTDYVNGGLAQKGPFLLSKTALMDATDLLATETDKVAAGDAEIIVLAGFVPTKTKGEGAKPGQCVLKVTRSIAGGFTTNCPLIAGAKHYGCLVTEGAPKPDWVVISDGGKVVVDFNHPAPPVPGPEMTGFIVDLTDQREKHFLNLKPGVTYYFYYYAVNATGVGPLSEVVSMVCW